MWRFSGDGVDDVGAGRDASGVAGDGQAGGVVDDVEDLDLGVIGQLPVGDVGLPAFVGLGGLESSPWGAGSFLGLCGDESSAAQDPPNSRHGRNFGDGRIGVQVGGDGFSAGVEALFVQGFAQPHDGVFDVDRYRARVVMGSARAGRERRVAFGFVAPHQLLYPGARHVVVAGDFAFAASF
jgi:hypothetical protein